MAEIAETGPHSFPEQTPQPEPVERALTPELQQRRYLTDVQHLLAGMDEQENVAEDVLQDVRTNLETAVCEIAMPYAVTTTAHRVEYREDAETRHRRRVITWLGKSVVENAANGRLYHFSDAAEARVDIEEAEAKDAEENLRPGIAKAFVSPKMSPADAPKEVAEAEHLADDDSIRTSSAITNARGEVVGRKLRSLLVRDIPLSAWYAMFKDPNNLFGKAYAFEREDSALPIMRLFSELELPEDQLAEGPAALVAAVLPYIEDKDAQASVARQLERFRSDQEMYERQAKETTDEWLAFDIELARSLRRGKTTFDIRRFIIGLQHHWSEEALQVISAHDTGNTHYQMTEELAAVLEKAKQNLLGSQAAVATGNEQVLEQVDAVTAQALQAEVRFIQQLRASGVPQTELQSLQAQLNRRFASANFSVGGGCPGKNTDNFNKQNPGDIDPLTGGAHEHEPDDPEDKSTWKWKRGVCRVESCPTRPNETKVGPCNVCEKCQAKFDNGEDPTEEVASSEPVNTEVPMFMAGALLQEVWHLPKPSELLKL